MGCAVVLLVLLVLGLAAAAIGRKLWHTEPSYWTQNQAFKTQTDTETLTDRADRAFNRILSELSDSRGYQPSELSTSPDSLGVRTIRLSFEEANAWLSTRLYDWLANQNRQMPPGVADPMLAASGDSLVAAFQYQNAEINQVFSVFLSLEFLENGQAVLSIDGIRGGRLPLPTQSVLERLPGENENTGQPNQALAVLMGEQPFDPILPIDGARRARIIGMEVDDDGVALIVQAEPNPVR